MELLDLVNRNPYTLMDGGFYPGSSEQSPSSDPPDDYVYSQRPDVDAFLQRVYQYYESHGLGCIVLTHLVNALIIGFTMTGLLFLGAFLDYATLIQTRDLGESFIFFSISDPSTSLDYSNYLSLFRLASIVSSRLGVLGQDAHSQLLSRRAPYH